MLRISGIVIAKHCHRMTLYDLIIVYLALGAPIGVYYFLQNRNLSNKKFFLLKVILNFLFWIPLAVSLVSKNHFARSLFDIRNGKKVVPDLSKQAKIPQLRKLFEKQILRTGLPLSIYEFREIFERYVGLTLELKTPSDKITDCEKEFFSIVKNENQKLAEICLHRRNRHRLLYHQNLARQDFWKIIEIIFETSPNQTVIFSKLLSLFQTLNDIESQKFLKNLAAASLQNFENENVSLRRNELWNSNYKKRLQLPNQTFLTKVPHTTTMRLFNKD